MGAIRRVMNQGSMSNMKQVKIFSYVNLNKESLRRYIIFVQIFVELSYRRVW